MTSKWLALCLSTVAWAQTNGTLNGPDGLALTERIVQLTEATSLTAPGLARSSAPMLENLKQLQRNARMANRLTLTISQGLLAETRGYLAVADSIRKPFPYPEEARKQTAELRDAVARLDAHFLALLETTEVQLRGSDRDNLRRYAEANRTVPPPTARRVVFHGDSITDGWRLNEYFPGMDFVNRGISGQITGEMLGRMQADIIAHKPQAMLILAGTNDIARGVAVETIQNNLTMIADLCEFHKIKVILASILPVSDYHKDKNPRFAMTGTRPPAVIREMNNWIGAFAKRRGFTYLNYYDAMVDPSGFLKAELADDGLHPNAAGYRIMAPLAQAAIDAVLPPVIPQQKAGRKRQK
ncbi:MAG: GDSL-type esterase/lipase family protein [Acidobacteriota bacterium]|jgi:lysophospholipase L1-like esterase